MTDAINPSHYKRLPAEAIEIIESAIGNAPSNRTAYLHGQVVKYVLRCWSKNGIEDLKKAKWYLDRLVDSFDTESDLVVKQDLKTEKWKPKVGDWVKINKPQCNPAWMPGMDGYDGQIVKVKKIDRDDWAYVGTAMTSQAIIHDEWAFCFDWLEPVKAPLNSDKIPEGYRKLNDSSEEPRQTGDLRWSVAERRYVEISGDEISYANRDNWAACRKVDDAK